MGWPGATGQRRGERMSPAYSWSSAGTLRLRGRGRAPGAIATGGVLCAGLVAFRNGNQMMSQQMMRTRVLFQVRLPSCARFPCCWTLSSERPHSRGCGRMRGLRNAGAHGGGDGRIDGGGRVREYSSGPLEGALAAHVWDLLLVQGGRIGARTAGQQLACRGGARIDPWTHC